jgi:hypothetical protein
MILKDIKRRFIVLFITIFITILLFFITRPIISRIVDYRNVSGISSFFLTTWYAGITFLIEIISITTLVILFMYQYKRKDVFELYIGFQYSAIYIVFLILILVMLWIINV